MDSKTEAVAGDGFLLGCISCKRREEVSARCTVDWLFKAQGRDQFSPVSWPAWTQRRLALTCLIVCVSSFQIFHYDHPDAQVLHADFTDRLLWHGTRSSDIQVGAIYIHNVTFNDTGTYRCVFHRTLDLEQPQYARVEKEVELTVVAERTSPYSLAPTTAAPPVPLVTPGLFQPTAS